MKKFLISISLLFFSILILIPSSTMAQAAYVGSKKCMSCHTSIYEMWKDTLHNKSQQVLSRTNDSLVVDWKGMIKLKAGNIPEVIIKLEEEKDKLCAHEASKGLIMCQLMTNTHII